MAPGGRIISLTFSEKGPIIFERPRRPVMEENKVGTVVKFFAKPSVAAIEVTEGEVKVGDILHFRGHSTDFTQPIGSMQVEHAQVDTARKGDSIGIKVAERVREHDEVYIVKE
jgi:putative protease